MEELELIISPEVPKLGEKIILCVGPDLVEGTEVKYWLDDTELESNELVITEPGHYTLYATSDAFNDLSKELIFIKEEVSKDSESEDKVESTKSEKVTVSIDPKLGFNEYVSNSGQVIGRVFQLIFHPYLCGKD